MSFAVLNHFTSIYASGVILRIILADRHFLLVQQNVMRPEKLSSIHAEDSPLINTIFRG
jgi:hypothetical protein